jgi:hypothetical protein
LLVAACVSGCATGAGTGDQSDAATSSGDGGGDATMMPRSDGGSSRDSGTSRNPDTGTDAISGADSGSDLEGGSDAGGDVGGPADAGADVAVVADSGGDAATGVDARADAPAGVDSGSTVDASPDASDAGPDAPTTTGFGTTCPAGTVYTDTFAANPLTSGNWTPLIGTVTYDSTNHLLQLAQGTPNTQAWIGAHSAWTNYTVSVPVRIDASTPPTGNAGINFRIVNPGPANPPNDSGQMYFAGYNATQVLLGAENTGWTQLALVPATFTLGAFHTITIGAKGTTLSVAIDGTTYVTLVDATFGTGGIGFRTYLAAASYGAVSVTCGP